ncbi:lisH domain-containing protein FOPNL isoform X3 [Calypte anna]|uniref:lisH domain-containing protein FOPNL isoform X3 n=1 Tax=Calypte anna TaxID=9244 RepID=UPI0011C439A5|nr:lisH domain-containing protein FOPNL isoform X3 [Calypte anna]
MATVAELKAVLKDTLEKRGALGEIKAWIRAEVFKALHDESEPRPQLSHENFLINELFREYLEFNNYKYTASVLTAALRIQGESLFQNLASLKCPWTDSFLPES